MVQLSLKHIGWSVSLSNRVGLDNKQDFDRLKLDRNKKTFIQALLFCFSYHDYFALIFYSKQIYSTMLVVGSFSHKSEDSRLPSCKIKPGRKRTEKPKGINY